LSSSVTSFDYLKIDHLISIIRLFAPEKLLKMIEIEALVAVASKSFIFIFAAEKSVKFLIESHLRKFKVFVYF